VRSLSEAAIAIRALEPQDARFIARLAPQAFGEYDPSAARTTAAMLREPGATTLLAARGDEPLGFVILRPEAPHVLSINAIAVTASARGRGVGRMLMQAAEGYAKSRGAVRLTLNTAQANLAALDLFLRRGFVIVDRSVVRYWRGQPACKLEKRLR
jgi:ribosomal protein S18 acetylase RimI-like enzyme